MDLENKEISTQITTDMLKKFKENYILLSKILGEPISEFDYEYRDKDGIPVYMGAYIRKFRDMKSCILDTRL